MMTCLPGHPGQQVAAPDGRAGDLGEGGGNGRVLHTWELRAGELSGENNREGGTTWSCMLMKSSLVHFIPNLH